MLLDPPRPWMPAIPMEYLVLWPRLQEDILVHYSLLYYERTGCYPTAIDVAPSRYKRIAETTLLIPCDRLAWILGADHKKSAHLVTVYACSDLAWYVLRCRATPPS